MQSTYMFVFIVYICKWYEGNYGYVYHLLLIKFMYSYDNYE